MAGRPSNSPPQSAALVWLRLTAPGISRWSAAKSSSVRTSIRTGVFAVPIKRASLSDEIEVGDDMVAPSQEKRDAILGHVASWGDRKTPITPITAKPARPVNVGVGDLPAGTGSVVIVFLYRRAISGRSAIARRRRRRADAPTFSRSVDPRSRFPRSTACAQRAAHLVRGRADRHHDGRRDRGGNAVRFDGAARRRLATASLTCICGRSVQATARR